MKPSETAMAILSSVRTSCSPRIRNNYDCSQNTRPNQSTRAKGTYRLLPNKLHQIEFSFYLIMDC